MITLNFTPFPVLETERMILRKPSYDDKMDFFEMRSNPDTMRFIPRPVAQVPDDVLPVLDMVINSLETKERINWAMTDKSNGKMIGMIGYVRISPDNARAEVGYSLHHDYRRTGLMYEALQAVLDYGFREMKLNSIEAVIHPDNIASWKLVEKAGFSRDAYFKDYNYHNNKFVDAVVYSLITPLKD